MYPSYPEQTQPFSGEESYKRLTSGSVLLAREVLHDPNFEATVVLICVHSEKGSYGLVLNRLAHMPLTELFDGFSGQNSAREVLIGGPVQQEEMQVIQITATPAEGAFPLAPTVYLGGRWQGIDEMVAADPTKTRLLLGYSGWDSGQLEMEVKIGAWDVYSVDIAQLLQNCSVLSGADTTAIASFLTSIATI